MRYTTVETFGQFSKETIQHFVTEMEKANAEIGVEIDTILVEDTNGKPGVAMGDAVLYEARETVCGSVSDLVLVVQPEYIVRYH